MNSVVVMMAARILSVSIDPDAWTQAHRIEWPDAHRDVLAIQPESGRYESGCGVVATETSAGSGEHYSFRFGQHCDRLLVLMDVSPGISSDPLAEQFLVQHEAFHVAAQLYGARVPFEFLGVDPTLVKEFSDGSRYQGFYRTIDLLFEDFNAGTALSCSGMVSKYDDFSASEKEYLDYKIFWEWPAEFYAQQVTFPVAFGRYESLRGGLFTKDNQGFEIFVTGVKVGLMLDGLMGRKEWQRRVADGASMYDLLVSRLGCVSVERGPAVRIERVYLK